MSLTFLTADNANHTLQSQVNRSYQKFLEKYVLPNAIFGPPKSSDHAKQGAAKASQPELRGAFQAHPALAQFLTGNVHYDVPEQKVHLGYAFYVACLC
jgi:hypothetical protein